MQVERSEFEELTKKKPDKAADRRLNTGLAQAALKMEAVTSDASWDTYSSYVQHAINVAKANRVQYAAMLSSPKLVNPDKIAEIRNEILIHDERIRCLEWTITMPAEIKVVGSVAKEKLALMDIEDAEGEVPDAA